MQHSKALLCERNHGNRFANKLELFLPNSHTSALMIDTSPVEQTEGSARATPAAPQHALLSKKIWLPRLLYDALPYFYFTAGFSAFFATLYINEWFWVLPHYLLFSAACIHLAIVVYRRRHPRESRRTRREQARADESDNVIPLT